MFKSKYIGLFVLAGLLMVSCKDEFLDGPPQGVLDQNTLGNQAGVEAALVASYSMLDGWGAGGGWGTAASNWTFGSVASDDAYKGSEPGDQQPITDIELYQWSTSGTDQYLNDKWRILYEGINRANATIRLLANVEEVGDADRTRIMGEALFLRGHYHFGAYRLWKNIPYYKEDAEDFRQTNTADAYPSIVADIEAAISMLPETQSDAGRVTKWVAKAYLGRVKSYANDWSGVKSTLDDVVNNGPHALEPCFHDVFTVALENGPETMLAYQATVNDGSSNGENGNRPDRLNFPHSGSPFGCCGFHQGSQNLVNAFKVDDNGLPLIGTFNDADATADDFMDPRVDWTVGRDDVPFLNHGIHNPNYIRAREWAGPYSPKKNIYHAGQGESSSVGWNSAHLSALNLHLLRYADVLLTLAEAEVEVGSLERARELVNMIRTRAGACAQGPGVDVPSITVPIDDPSITWANYKIGTYDDAWTDQAAARAAVRMERRLELAMEGHRFFDLRRWGTFKEVLNDYLAVEATKRNYLTAANQVEDRHALYPLPTVQVDLSRVEGEDRLVQNPGW